jgi:hypothetical protein
VCRGDQHGLSDPVINRLWLEGQRANAKSAASLWRQMSNRTITQAYVLQVVGVPYFTFYSKKIGGIAKDQYRQNPKDWFLTRN